jgi:peptidoglycan biosynthesis protein MviN/MurJ (putative lipid II flippase)
MDQEQLKHVGDALSVGTVVATIAGWLPAVAALVTIIWTGIRIFETQTVQKLLKKFRNRKE